MILPPRSTGRRRLVAAYGPWRLLLEEGVISGKDLAGAWERFFMTGYLRLAEHVSLRYLETPHLYDRQADELYEVNEAGFDWLARCDGTTPGLAAAG